MKTTNQAIEQFIIQESLISPIKKILKQLEDGNFRDCDIKWLNTKLENYTKIAAETLNLKIQLPELNYTTFNYFVKNKFSNYFQILLKYFESF